MSKAVVNNPRSQTSIQLQNILCNKKLSQVKYEYVHHKIHVRDYLKYMIA